MASCSASGRRTFGMRHLFKAAYQSAIRNLPMTLSVILQYIRHHQRFPHLYHPVLFTEKLYHRKLYDKDRRFVRLANKIAVKRWAAQKLGTEWIIPSLFEGNALPPRAERDWPVPFVIKPNNSSGRCIFVTERNVDWTTVERECRDWLADRKPNMSGDWYYDPIEPALLVEPMLGSSAPPHDYKIFVFSGVAHYVQVDTDRFVAHKRTLFTRDWRPVRVNYGYPMHEDDLAPPKGLDELLAAAELLGGEFSFCRIDLYDVEPSPKFGEVTFVPDSGEQRFIPRSFDEHLGRLWAYP